MLNKVEVSIPLTLHALTAGKANQNNEFGKVDISIPCLSLRLLAIFFSFMGTANAQSPEWLWAKAMGGTDLDWPKSLSVDASGNIYTTGFFSATSDFDPGAGTFDLTAVGEFDIFISKLNSSGNFVWAISMGGA